MPVTHDGSGNGKFLGILTDKDFWEFEDDLKRPVSEFMTPKKNVVYGTVGITLHEANSLLRKHKKECLPILDKDGKAPVAGIQERLHRPHEQPGRTA